MAEANPMEYVEVDREKVGKVRASEMIIECREGELKQVQRVVICMSKIREMGDNNPIHQLLDMYQAWMKAERDHHDEEIKRLVREGKELEEENDNHQNEMNKLECFTQILSGYLDVLCSRARSHQSINSRRLKSLHHVVG